jgi:hypothetical protein
MFWALADVWVGCAGDKVTLLVRRGDNSQVAAVAVISHTSMHAWHAWMPHALLLLHVHPTALMLRNVNQAFAECQWLGCRGLRRCRPN